MQWIIMCEISWKFRGTNNEFKNIFPPNSRLAFFRYPELRKLLVGTFDYFQINTLFLIFILKKGSSLKL